MVRIRMQRLGRTHRPFYRINAVDIRVQRNGRVIENLGWFNPVERTEEKQVSLKEDRIKDWLARGAQPSDTVRDILGKRDLLTGRLRSEWEADREVAMRRGRCKAAIKQIEAAIKTGEAMLEDGDTDADAVQPLVNRAKRNLNDAKRTVSLAQADRAEQLAEEASAALNDAKSASDAAKKAKDEAEAKAAAEAAAAEAEGDADGDADSGEEKAEEVAES